MLKLLFYFLAVVFLNYTVFYCKFGLTLDSAVHSETCSQLNS